MENTAAQNRVIVGLPVSVPIIWTALNGDILSIDIAGDKAIGIHQELPERDVSKRNGLHWGHRPGTRNFDSLKNMDCLNADPDGLVAWAERIRDVILAARERK